MVLTVSNAAINNVLCYITSARCSYSEQVISTTCLSFYNSEKIEQAKEVLFNCLLEPITKRRGDNKSRSDVSDILEILKKSEAKKLAIPKFLCDSHGKMPPTSGFEVIAEHLLELVMQMSTLKDELKAIKAKPENNGELKLREIHEDLRDLKLSMAEFKRANRGSSNTKMPFNNFQKPSTSSASVNFANAVKKNSKLSVPRSPLTPNNANETPIRGSRSLVDKSERNVTNPGDIQENSAPSSADRLPLEEDSASVIQNNSTVPSGDLQPAREDSDSALDVPNDGNNDNHWEVVQRRKRRNFVSGSRKADSAFRGVVGSRDLYVGRCQPSVSCDVILNHIEDVANVRPLSCETISKEDSRVKAFKVTVAVSDVEKLLDSALWPEEVRVRRYFNRPRRGNSNN